MEKVCRQLTYHLSPHSQWRRQGLLKRKPQAWWVCSDRSATIHVYLCVYVSVCHHRAILMSVWLIQSMKLLHSFLSNWETSRAAVRCFHVGANAKKWICSRTSTSVWSEDNGNLSSLDVRTDTRGQTLNKTHTLLLQRHYLHLRWNQVIAADEK